MRIEITKPGAIALAVTDMRGTGAAQPLMSVFNTTLYDDLKGSGLFSIVPKGVLPLNTPQQPTDFKGVTNPAAGSPAAEATISPTGRRRRRRPTIWPSATPAVQDNVLTLYGWLYNVTQDAAGRAGDRQALFRRRE